ncbi:MAG: tRNA pseudouridine(38-40) synthase TruA [Slackia sp.]|nr:tRNA pseudouridine(38-40) synthase TruA [Slackia sp.]
MPTIALTVAYNGEPFAGFARQAESHVKTVQGELEQALSLLYRREVKTVCAGRTDAGVHALGQVVSFDLSDEELHAKPLRSLQRSMNALVDDAISISAAEEKPLGFNARFDARWREYHYHICAQSARPVLVMPLVWHLGGVELDIDAMRAAAARLVGEHDFKSFCMAASAHMIEADGRSTCRNVMVCDVYPETIAGTSVVTVRVVGNAFLHSMVRTMVGTLVEVGRGKRDACWVDDVLAARDRSAAGQNAPAAGLTFWRVGYDEYFEASAH